MSPDPQDKKSTTPTPKIPAGPPPNGDRRFGDLQTYPILVEDVNLPSAAPSSGGAATGTGSLGQVADKALRDVLGWRPKDGDVKGFVAALNQSFTVSDDEGHTELSWTPRTYAVQVQADLGAVTGAQASIYTRAKAALDQSLPLLDGLTPLIVTEVAEDQESIRSIVRAELIQMVAELGIPGGPRVQRVDEYFGLLLFGKVTHFGQGSETASIDELLGHPGRVAGQLGKLRDRFGLSRENVNTIDDEQNLTNFLVLVDYVSSLCASWNYQRPFFERGNFQSKKGTHVTPFLGTQLVLLSRALAVVAESVDEVAFVLDSVFIGAAERQMLELAFPEGHLFVAELLDWIQRSVTDEGLKMIQDAGKDGVQAFLPTLFRLKRLVFWTWEIASGKPNDETTFQTKASMTGPTASHSEMTSASTSRHRDRAPVPDGFRTPRSEHAWRELLDELQEACNLAAPLGRQIRPFALAISPSSSYPDHKCTIDIKGSNFQSSPNSVVVLRRSKDDPPISTDQTTQNEPQGQTDAIPGTTQIVDCEGQRITATFNLATALPGDWDVYVYNPVDEKLLDSELQQSPHDCLRRAFCILKQPDTAKEHKTEG